MPKRSSSSRTPGPALSSGPTAKRNRVPADPISDEESSDSSYEPSGGEKVSDRARPLTFRAAPSTLAPTPLKPDYYELLESTEFLTEFSKKLTDLDQSSRELYQLSVVNVYSNRQDFDFSAPWQHATADCDNATGFVLEYEGNRFVVIHANQINFITYLSLRISNDNRYYRARILVADHVCQLGLLTVDDEEFWQRVKPLKLGNSAILRQPVLAIGFEAGGDEMSIKPGEVSRIEVNEYCDSGSKLLRMQMTAPINAGSTGGPVLDHNGDVVGVALESRTDGEGLHYAVPRVILEHLLKDYIANKDAPGGYRGFPALGIKFQTISNDSLRHARGLKDGDGVIITKVNPLCSSYGILNEDDVLLAIDGCPIKNDGTVNTDDGHRLSFSHLISRRFIYDTVIATVLRGSATSAREMLRLEIPVLYREFTTTLVGPENHATPPTFYIVGSVVITKVTRELIDDHVSATLISGEEQLAHLEDKSKKLPGDEIVIFYDILPSEHCRELAIFKGDFITEVNGKKINNLREAIIAFQTNTRAYHDVKTNQQHAVSIPNLTPAEHAVILQGCADRSADLLKDPVYQPGCPEYEALVRHDRRDKCQKDLPRPY